ncbi:MAG: hypothetical protein J2P27_18310, partial [Actinobacteria bacterium]|nr:hypothetical protein [Actinomycetota bacterium]
MLGATVGAVVALGVVTVDAIAVYTEHHPSRATGGRSGSASATQRPASRAASAQPSAGPSGKAVATSSLRQIILPDLLIVAPGGLTSGQLTQLRAVGGVRNLISFDGAEITAGGAKASVIGVNPVTFQPWVPLRTASDDSFWSDLTHGEFVAGEAASESLGLIRGGSYRLVGAS